MEPILPREALALEAHLSLCFEVHGFGQHVTDRETLAALQRSADLLCLIRQAATGPCLEYHWD